MGIIPRQAYTYTCPTRPVVAQLPPRARHNNLT